MHKDQVIKTLSEWSAIPVEVKSDVDLIAVLEHGLPVDTLVVLQEKGVVDQNELKWFIAARTLARRKKNDRLTPEESDLIVRLLRIFEFAVGEMKFSLT